MNKHLNNNKSNLKSNLTIVAVVDVLQITGYSFYLHFSPNFFRNMAAWAVYAFKETKYLIRLKFIQLVS